jgi:ArsR family transcriptional regulator
MLTLKNSRHKAEEVAQIVKALAHPIRLRILAILCDGAENVNALADRLDVTQSLISQHLRVMRSQGLLVTERRGSLVYYALSRDRLKLLVQYLDGCP